MSLSNASQIEDHQANIYMVDFSNAQDQLKATKLADDAKQRHTSSMHVIEQRRPSEILEYDYWQNPNKAQVKQQSLPTDSQHCKSGI